MATYKQVAYGSQGSDVKNLQNMLNSNGYKLDVDGIFGAKTQAAVKDYQKNNNLAVDGIVGTNTWGSLTGATSKTLPGGTGTNKASATAPTLSGTGASSKTLPGGTGTNKTGASAQVLPGGMNNSAAGYSQVLPGGMNTSASGYGQVLPGGANTSAAGSSQVLPGGMNASANGYSQVLPGGTNATASAYGQVLPGGMNGMAGGYGQVLPGSNGAYAQGQGYQSTWQSSVDEALRKILNREEFSYDLNGDALYQQYKDQYTMQGQQAMMDTMGQAQAMTGGYGNSYAQSVGQQTYQGYLQQLNDIVPELYQMALDKYQREGEELYNQYGILADRENQDYGRYRDQVGDQQWQSQFDYQKERDQIGDQQWQSQFDYQKDRDQISDDQWKSQFEYQQNRDKTSDDQWKAEFDEAKRRYDQEWEKKYPSSSPSQNPSGGGGGNGGGGGGTGYDNGGINDTYIKALQRMLGVTADGKWGPATAAAAKKKWGVTSAKDAYTKVYGNKNGGNDGGGNGGGGGNDGFTGSTYSEAAAYLKSKGKSASGLMTQTEWVRHKNNKNSAGGEHEASTYQEYLQAYIYGMMN